VLAAALTPFDAAGEPDASMLIEHCRALLDEGCDGLVILGTTGEANSLTVKQRERLAERLIAGGIEPRRLVVGTGCSATGDTVRLSKHALSLGICRLLQLPPFYYKGVSDDGLFQAFARCIERIGDQRARIILYLIPQLSGVELSADLIERLHAAFGATIAGCKDSAGDWAQTEALCRRLAAKLDIFVGSERWLREALAAGAVGCVSATANVNAAAIAALYRRLTREADAADRSVIAVRTVFDAFPMIAALKEFVARRSGDARWRSLLPPLSPLDPDQANRLVEELARAGASFV